MAEKNFDAFKQTREARFMGHPVVTANAYAKLREEPFLTAGVTMLDRVKVFWDGLDTMRRGSDKFAA